MDHDESIAFSALAARPGASAAALRAALAEHGSYQSAQLASGSPAELEAARRQIDRLARLGVRVVGHGEAGYPEALTRIPDPPAALYLRGALGPADDLAVAIVGSRRASPEGRRIALTLGRALGSAGFTVVSGLARGIDARAHEGALDGKGRTIAVLGSGIDVLYPPEHADLAGRIAANGALLSELAPGAPPLPHHFPQRNRILAGLVQAVVVVEAAERSGSLITARLACDYNRAVLAVPGSPLSEAHRGTNRLIHDGAVLLGSLEDLVDELPPELRQRFAAAREEERRASLGPAEQRVLAALDGRNGQLAEAVARAAGCGLAETMTALAGLLALGRAARLPGALWIRLEGARALAALSRAAERSAARDVLSSGIQLPEGAA